MFLHFLVENLVLHFDCSHEKLNLIYFISIELENDVPG